MNYVIGEDLTDPRNGIKLLWKNHVKKNSLSYLADEMRRKRREKKEKNERRRQKKQGEEEDEEEP